MPRKKKQPKDMTSEELARKVFPPAVLKELKRVAKDADQPSKKSSRNQSTR